MADPVSPTTSSRWGRDLLLLLLAFGALYFYRLGVYPLSNPDEGRYAEVPREMLATGDWVTPRLDGVNYFEKPPLVYWATAISERVFGLNEWAVRGVPVMFSLLGILITYAAVRHRYDRGSGLAAATVLGTSLLWFVVGHIPLLDTAVSVFMSATLFCFWLGVNEPPGARRRWLFMGLYAAAALATLTKGMIGFLVTGAVMFLWLLVFNQWKRLRPLYLPTGVGLFLLIALPWHILAALRNETWFHRYVVYEHFLRYLTPAASRPGPWYYFIPVVIGGLLPWTGFAWPRVAAAFRQGWSRRGEQADAWFLITWVAFIVFFFSTSKSKLVPYVLPVFPALAALAGPEIARAWRESRPRSFRVGYAVFAILFGLLAIALALVALRPALFRIEPTQAAALHGPALVLAALLAAATIGVPRVGRSRGAHAAILALVLVMVGFYATLQDAAPAISKPGTKTLALWVKAHARPEDRVYHWHDFYQDFTFYAERIVGVVGRNHAELEIDEDPAAGTGDRFISDQQLRQAWAGPERIFLVVRIRKIAESLREYREAQAKPDPHKAAPEWPIFADPTFQYHLIAQTPDYYLLSNRP